jgi:hypothetical protein
MTRDKTSDWIPWYIDELEIKVTCRICRDSFAEKKLRILHHLGYIRRIGDKDPNVKLYKKMKADVACAF